MQKQRTIIAWQPEAIKGLSALVASEPLQAWKDWLIFHTLNRNAKSFLFAIVACLVAAGASLMRGGPSSVAEARSGHAIAPARRP